MHQKRKLLLHPGKTHINQQIYNIFYHAFHCVANFSLVFNFVEYLADLVTEEINLVSRMKFWVGAYCHKRPWKASLFPIGFYEILWPHLFLGCWSLRILCLCQRSLILSYRYRKSDIFRDKYRIGIVSVSKFMKWKVSYQYRLFKVESISIGICITFFITEYQI